MFVLFYIFLLSAFFLFLKKIGKNVDYKYIYGIYRIGNNLSFLEKISKSKLVTLFEYLAIPAGFPLMFLAIYLIFYGIKIRVPTVVPVIPGLEVYGIKFPVFEVVFAIFLSALVHELAHAILAIKNKVSIKSFGIFFLGPFLGAFVEPSDDLFKLDKKKQIAIFNAGIFANFLFAVLCFSLYFLLFNIPFFEPKYSVYIVGKVPNITNVENLSIGTDERVLYIGGMEIKKIKDIETALRNYSPGEKIEIITDKNKYIIELSEKDGKPFIGLYFAQNIEINFLLNLLFWIFIISLGISLGNALPIVSLDGGLALKTALSFLIKDEKKLNKIQILISAIVISAIIFNFLLLLGK